MMSIFQIGSSYVGQLCELSTAGEEVMGRELPPTSAPAVEPRDRKIEIPIRPDLTLAYINNSQIHEFRNLEGGCAQFHLLEYMFQIFGTVCV
jgi:hypothetical protein